MSIDKMLSSYKTEAELRAFAEASQKTLLQVMKKNKELTDEVEHLKKLVSGAVPIVKKEGESPLSVGSDEEEIAKIELRKLRDKAMDPDSLMLEDAKKVEIYSKILASKQKKESNNEREVKELDANELLALVESPSSDQAKVD